MPTSTEAERLAKQRIGQGIFPASLDDYRGGRCPVTGIADRPLLRASRTKPWALCATDEERFDVDNGFLLDAAFDAALITFNEGGRGLPVAEAVGTGDGAAPPRRRLHPDRRGPSCLSAAPSLALSEAMRAMRLLSAERNLNAIIMSLLIKPVCL